MKHRMIMGVMLLGALLWLAACGSQTNTSQGTTSSAPTTVPGARAVHVVIQDGTITSSMKNFNAGIPYTFTVVNQGKTSHNFIILKRISGAAATTPPPNSGILYIVPATQLTPGTTRTFSYQFPLSAEQGSLQFTTHLAGPGGPEGAHIPVNVTKG